ncbi:MAG: type II secretion system protein N [Betaproteobacteria bacterium]|nr:type II secretion system protein N [Betaproteobacteria bacterium]MDH3438706.1 type II secretion system protein N [Betaproteobacteria bacterium]
MRRWRLIGFGLGAYALGLIVTAPATLIDTGLRQASEGRIRLAEARGTLWSGTGQIEMRDVKRRTGIARNVVWRVLPAYFLRGKLRYEVALDHAVKRFPATISLSRIEVADADINLPAAVLGLGVPKLAGLELAGDVLLHVARLSLGRGAIEGNGTLQWRGAGSALAPVSPLGDYELRFKGDGSVVRASLRTLQGPLRLDGEGSWTSGRNPVFLATARIPPQYQQQLAPLLRLIAVERSDGSFTLQLK